VKATSDDLIIGHGITDDHGQRLEAEEQPVDRKLATVLPVSLGNGPGDGKLINVPMRGHVTVESTAGEIAAEFSRRCELCVHWDQATYQRERRSYDVDELNEQRASVLELASAAQLSAVGREHADAILDASLGRCQALSSYSPDGRLDIHAHASCPVVSPTGQSIPAAFKPRPEMRRAATTIRDRILLAAEGKATP
jgi:hypothetical protein